MSIQAFKSVFYGVGVFFAGKAIVEVGRESFNYSLKPSCMIENLVGRLFGEISTFASTDYCSATNIDHCSVSNTCGREYSTNFVDVMLVGSLTLTLLCIAKRALFKKPVKLVIDEKAVGPLLDLTEQEWEQVPSFDIPWHRKEEAILFLLREFQEKTLSKESMFIKHELDNIDRSIKNLTVCKRAWQHADPSTRDKLITSLAETLPCTYKHCLTQEESIKLFNTASAFYKGCARIIFAELEKEDTSYPIHYLTNRVRDAFGQYSYFLSECELMMDNLPRVRSS